MRARRAWVARLALAAFVGAAGATLPLSCAQPYEFPIFFDAGPAILFESGSETAFAEGGDSGSGTDSFSSESGDGTAGGDCCFGDGFSGDSGPGDAGPGDGPIFDVGDLGDCSGLVAKAIPASECGSCVGGYAYALCDGVFYSTCSCTLPPGYELAEGGGIDAGPEAAAKDSPSDGVAAKDATGG